ncbi:uncharacterized protein PV09_04830 [Verruconis gallopava]|uniref:type I protein arginine methyltransferase n=1 Tax=Verruconis gallopava TaxID=253628 RepID=A0A0D2AB69_9PEZI|nr:uncharacterized protein PV09_04830 [Verruconis gallopava]KIW04003.1 hypothetical protein PV09_04830 [Verruconis gallopava]
MAAETKDSIDDLSSTSSLSERDDDDNGWEDAEPDEEKIQILSLFDDRIFNDAKSMLDYCKERYHFDFISVQKQHNLDFYQSIKLVNYIRAAVKEGNTRPDVDLVSNFADEKYLQPVLEDDALLFSLDDLSAEEANPESQENHTPEARIAELEAQLSVLQARFADFRAQVDQTLERRWTESNDISPVVEKAKASSGPDYEGDYFESYSYNAIHEEMLKDKVRTDAYRDFIYEHKHLFANKIVLDVGCGTGILSMFCARAGAARVIAVDNSDIIDKARAHVFANGLSDTITCLRGKIEEIVLPVEKVDVIVSEWMGYCLLFEAMLDSVLWARDRYLAPDGLMVPSHTVLRVAPLSDSEFVLDNVEFWKDVYGFDMSAMQEKIYEDVLVRQMPVTSLAGASFPFAVLDLHNVKTEQLVFTTPFEVSLLRDVDALDGFLIYFDTFFLTSRTAQLPSDAQAETWSSEGVAFTTGPQGKETHWRSGVMLIDRSKVVPTRAEKGAIIKGTIEYRKGRENSRGLEIDIKWLQAGAGRAAEQSWFLK